MSFIKSKNGLVGRRILKANNNSSIYARNFIFGVEDSLVSTVGVLSGIFVGGGTRSTILLVGLIIIFVEAFSMGIGSLLSEHSVEELEEQKEVPIKGSFVGAAIMFFSYFFAGFVPLVPYLFLGNFYSFEFSVGLSLIALFCLGVAGAKISNTGILRHGLQMMFIGGAAIAVGVAVGRIFGGA